MHPSPSSPPHRWDEVCRQTRSWSDLILTYLRSPDFLSGHTAALDNQVTDVTSDLKKIVDTPIGADTSEEELGGLIEQLQV